MNHRTFAAAAGGALAVAAAGIAVQRERQEAVATVAWELEAGAWGITIHTRGREMVGLTASRFDDEDHVILGCLPDDASGVVLSVWQGGHWTTHGPEDIATVVAIALDRLTDADRTVIDLADAVCGSGKEARRLIPGLNVGRANYACPRAVRRP